MNLDNKPPRDKSVLRTKSKHKHLEEYYDEHLNEILPKYFHRGDVVSTDRMLGYADAVMATCATFLVIPIRNLHEMKTESLSDFIYSIRTELIMFFLGFTVVLTIWENINVRTMVIKRVDDFILSLVILEMLATTVLPFSLSLQGHYPHQKTSIILTCCLLGLIQIIDIAIICYSMETPRLLHIDLKNWTKSELHRLRNIMVLRPFLSIIFLVFGGVCCLVHYSLSWFFIALLTLMPTIRKLYLYLRRRMNKTSRIERYQFYFHYSKGNMPKQRVEVMSDSAIAIITCILILDITVEKFPQKKDVDEKGLNFVLENMKSGFLIFLATFNMVSILWYVNHTVIHLFKTVTTLMLYLQKIFLSFCCLCPLAGNAVLKFASTENEDTKTGIRFAALIVFWSSIANLFILFYGLLTDKKYMHQWAAFDHFKANTRQHLYTIFKTLNVPFWPLLCTLGTLGPPKIAKYFLYITFFAAPLSFIAAKFLLMNHIGKAIRRRTTRKSTIIKQENKIHHAATIEHQGNNFLLIDGTFV
ncbi:endosomal/lysosomal proton channel TMEM175 [Hydra vulgaris]|uniref:endosomal/lysosomal proton channel TMEM175 n=1 Tax=Hydra vulgaris TaxID=6087 RepID=UPI0002B47F15|nr:endosomal/lysosomal potassium channel TMEM175-like [Hydra vulgaris]